jgi:hypothetical protein
MSDEGRSPDDAASSPVGDQQADSGVNSNAQPNQEGAGSPLPISSNWNEPLAITVVLPPVQRLNVAYLVPEPFVRYVYRVARDMQVRVDAVAVMLMGVLSGAVCRRALIKPKPNSTWAVYGILWTILVLASGSLKSPILKAALHFLEELQEEAFIEYAREKELYQLEVAQNPEGGLEEPICRRFISNEATVAALHKLLTDNPFGLMIVRDEIMALILSFVAKDHQADKDFLLEAWSGTGSFTMDRIGRGMIHVPKLGVVLFGATQPGRFQQVVAAAVERGTFQDGFFPRFQLLVWPDETPNWEYVDEPADPTVEERVREVFRRAINLSDDEPLECRFDVDAQALFEQFLERLEYRIRRQETNNVIRECLGKYRSLMPAVALLLQVAEDPDTNEIPLHRARRAELWCQFLESHIRRAYSCVMGGVKHPTQVLADRIRAGALGSQFSVRQVYLHDWAGLTSADAVRAALQELEEADWVRRVTLPPGPQGGRPSEVYEVNPKIYRP